MPTSLPSPHPGSQALVRGGLQGLQRQRLPASYWLASLATRAPASLSSIPSAGRRSRRASPGAPGIRGSCRDPATASERREARGAASVPKALFRRADHAALPWLQTATAGEARRRAPGRQGAVPAAPLALGSTVPLLCEPVDALEGAGPGSALSSSETNNSSRGERSASEPPAARARRAPALGRSRPASLPALLPHMKQLQSRGFWGVGAGVYARACVSVFNSFPPFFLPLPACSPACLRPPPSLSYTQRGRERHTHSHTHAHAQRRLHEWETGANPTRPGERRRTGAASRAAPRRGGAPRR